MRHEVIDPFDPNDWVLGQPHEFRIYGDDNAQTWGVVDEIDYHFLIQWKWTWTTPKKGFRAKPKLYLKRNIETQIESPYRAGGLWVNPETGNTVKFRKPRLQQTLRMQTVIMLRTGIAPPTPKHILVDHRDGDEFNYRRDNLRWATHSMNKINLFGSHADDEAMEEKLARKEALVRRNGVSLRDEVSILRSGSGSPSQLPGAMSSEASAQEEGEVR